MIFIKDAKELRFILFNKAGEKILGHKSEDLLGKNDYDFFPKEQADFFRTKDMEVLGSGQLYEIAEEPIDTKTGRRILHTKKIPIRDKNGKQAYLLGISEDITERKQAEAALIGEKSFSDAMIQVSPGTFYLFDEQGKLLRWNENLEQLAQDLGQEISKMSLLDFFVGDARSRVAEAIQRGFSEGETSVEAEVITNDGNETPYLFTAKRVSLHDQQCLMGVGIDLSYRVRAEKELRKSREMLELALTGADLGWWDLNVETGQAVVNQRAANMVGYSLDEIEPTLSFFLNLIHILVMLFNMTSSGVSPCLSNSYQKHCRFFK